MRAAPPVLELSIDALAAGGDGVGRGPDGRVVFVPFAAPGDRLRVRVIEERARFARGEIEAVLEPGADRVTPACAVFGRCGGCAWQHVAYAAQVDAKRAILGDALARIARLGAPPAIEFTASPAAYGYRGRARVLVSRGQVGFRQRRAHAVCAVTSCPLLLPALDRALGALAAAPPAGDGEWELAAGSDGRVRVAPLDAAARRRPAAREAGPDPIELVAAGERIRVSPGVFAQAHALLLDALAEALLEAAGTGDTVLELHAGAGFFTLGLARRFARVVAIESDPDAIRDLAGNVAAAGLRQVRVVEARVEAWLAGGEADTLGADVVVLDPPRGGIGALAAAALARSPARRLAYLSCDPATWARDLAVLLSQDWRLARVHGFDLFPQTPHVEALAVLERTVSA